MFVQNWWLNGFQNILGLLWVSIWLIYEWLCVTSNLNWLIDKLIVSGKQKSHYLNSIAFMGVRNEILRFAEHRTKRNEPKMTGITVFFGTEWNVSYSPNCISWLNYLPCMLAFNTHFPSLPYVHCKLKMWLVVYLALSQVYLVLWITVLSTSQGNLTWISTFAASAYGLSKNFIRISVTVWQMYCSNST